MASRSINFDSSELAVVRAALQAFKPLTAHQQGFLLRVIKRIDRKETRIKVSSAKAKGRDFQKWVCQKISEGTGIPYDQSDDQCLIHSREMGQHGKDIVLRGDADKAFPFSVECKNSETISLPAFIEQAKANSTDARPWLLALKNKKVKPVVVLAFETFFKLCFGKSYNSEEGLNADNEND